MSGKASPIPIVRDHYQTFWNAQTDKPKISDYIVQVGLPIAAGAFSAFKKYSADDIGAFLGGVAVFAALLFALVVFVFQLRLSAGEDPKAASKPRFLQLIDELFANVSYAVFIGLVTTGLGILAIWISDDDGSAPIWVSTLLITAVTHLVLTILMCLKRINAAYRRMPK